MSSSSPLSPLDDPRYVPPTYDPAAYERPSVTVDVALFATFDDKPHVLLVRRKGRPYAGYWALPGGFIAMDETLEQSARRELQEETGMAGVALEQLYTFGDPGRDPRTRVISVAYWGVLETPAAHPLVAADDAADATWWPLDALPPLAFDHDRILDIARRRLEQRGVSDNNSGS